MVWKVPNQFTEMRKHEHMLNLTNYTKYLSSINSHVRYSWAEIWITKICSETMNNNCEIKILLLLYSLTNMPMPSCGPCIESVYKINLEVSTYCILSYKCPFSLWKLTYQSCGKHRQLKLCVHFLYARRYFRSYYVIYGFRLSVRLYLCPALAISLLINFKLISHRQILLGIMDGHDP